MLKIYVRALDLEQVPYFGTGGLSGTIQGYLTV